jgi:integrating conjugative element protein (TIGR03761 family)
LYLGERNMTERKPTSLLRQPGALRSQTSMEIQTRQAQRLVYGRRADGGKPAIFGLLRFGTMLRPIWEGAATDDPWADWCLVQIERDLLEAREALEALMAQIQKRLNSLPAMDVAVAQSVEPVKVDLTFTSPYAFMGAYLLADYDVLVRAVLTGRHVGLFDRDTAERTLRGSCAGPSTQRRVTSTWASAAKTCAKGRRKPREPQKCWGHCRRRLSTAPCGPHMHRISGQFPTNHPRYSKTTMRQWMNSWMKSPCLWRARQHDVSDQDR